MGLIKRADRLREVMLPRGLEKLSSSGRRYCLWRLEVYVDRLIPARDPLRNVEVQNRLCLRGAGRWAGCAGLGHALRCSGCVGGIGRRVARPLPPVA
jgi:hypothetical protein